MKLEHACARFQIHGVKTEVDSHLVGFSIAIHQVRFHVSNRVWDQVRSNIWVPVYEEVVVK